MKNNLILPIVLLLFLSGSLISCNNSSDGKEASDVEMNENQDDATISATDENPVIVVVNHPVKEFESWKKGFEDHRDKREEAQLEERGIYVAADDPNNVYISLLAKDVDAARNFMNSSDLKTTMENLGVTGEPTTWFYQNVYFKARDHDNFLAIQHEVEDYEKWKKAFDDHENVRQETGIEVFSVNYELDDKHQVMAVLTADDLETLRDFMNNKELASAMADAGVVGKPDFHLIKVKEQYENAD